MLETTNLNNSDVCGIVKRGIKLWKTKWSFVEYIKIEERLEF